MHGAKSEQASWPRCNRLKCAYNKKEKKRGKTLERKEKREVGNNYLSCLYLHFLEGFYEVQKKRTRPIFPVNEPNRSLK